MEIRRHLFLKGMVMHIGCPGNWWRWFLEVFKRKVDASHG